MGVRERRERERSERKERILAAAQHVLLERGLAGTTIEVVASAAELSKGAVYLYFESKDELCAAVLQRRAHELRERLLSAAPTSPGLTRVRAMLEAYVRESLERHAEFTLAAQWFRGDIANAPEGSERSRYVTMVVRLIGTVGDAIRQGQSDGSVRPSLDPLVTSIMLFASLAAVLHLHLHDRRVLDAAGAGVAAETAGYGLVDLLCRGLPPVAKD